LIFYKRHTHVFAFARYTENEIAIIAINFNEAPVIIFFLIFFFLNLKNNKIKIFRCMFTWIWEI